MADHNHAHASHADHHDGHEEHVHSVEHYRNVYLALVALFLVSVAGPMVGDALDLRIITLLTAFGIAVVKASMVVHYFMHLTVEKRFVHYFLVTSLAFMFLFFFAVAPDVMKHEGTNWKNVSAQQTVEKVNAEHAAGGGEHGGGHGDGHGASAGEHH